MWISSVAAAAALALLAGTAPPASPDAFTLIAGAGAAGFRGDGKAAVQATLNRPSGIAAGPDGIVYIADTGNRRVRAVGPDGIIRTVAGTGRAPTGALVTPAKATDVALRSPAELAVGADGVLYIADPEAKLVYALARDGSLTVRAKVRSSGLAVSGRTLYVADRTANKILAVAPDGRSEVVAGSGSRSVNQGGGPATTVGLGELNALAVDAGGDLWISGGGLARRLAAKSVATVTRPAPGRWSSTEGAQWPTIDPPLADVDQVTADADGPYVVDRAGAVLRLDPAGPVTTVASLAGLPSVHLAAAAGVVYVADSAHNRVFAVRAPVRKKAPQAAASSPPWTYLIIGVVLLLVLVVLVRLAQRGPAKHGRAVERAVKRGGLQ